MSQSLASGAPASALVPNSNFLKGLCNWIWSL